MLIRNQVLDENPASDWQLSVYLDATAHILSFSNKLNIIN